MNRRSFLISAAASSLCAQGSDPLVRPHALKPGDTVGLITPSTFVSDPDSLALAERTISYFELKPKWGKNVRQREGYLGGAVQGRLDDLHAMFRDREVKAIVALRGGYGAAQLLDRIDYDLIRSNPKILLGYSDITALVTFHGPVVLSRFTGYTQEHFRAALFDPKPMGAIANPPDSNPLRPAHILRTVRPGKARGRLIGGNLTLICSLMGTPYEIDTRGRILFTEDVDEEPYRIDRMLTQLRLAGKLDAAAGIVFGECADCRPKDYKPSFSSTFTLGEVLDRILGDLKIPVLSGLTIGHTEDQLTLPEGVMATLDADKQELILEEAAVVA
jgi:muramoyltetrapeptide carboxypeptidase